MSYGVMFTVSAPIAMYDAVHAEASQHPADGLIMHLVREVDDGFQVIEVWESKEQHDRFGEEVLGPIVARLAGADAEAPPSEEFDVHTLVVPSAVIG
jgi:hypothetical protein